MRWIKPVWVWMALVGLAAVLAASLGSFTVRADLETQPSLAGCPVQPADNIWNAPVNDLPVLSRSAAYIQSVGPNTGLHMDFGSGLWEGAPIGIPYNLVNDSQPKVPVSFTYASESDPGPYPIPPNPLVEGGSQSSGDRHVLILDTSTCILYELYAAYPPQAGHGWTAGSGAIFDLRSNALRPAGWTSADAAGLPILPGLVRYDEVASGHIEHALRFTVSVTQKAYVWPARHFASTNTSLLVPPMGTRFRLKATFNTSGYSPQARVILEALKTYGMIVADNGSNWYISGVPDERWNNDILHELDNVTGENFEVVDSSSLMVNPDSGQTHTPAGIPRVWIPFILRKQVY